MFIRPTASRVSALCCGTVLAVQTGAPVREDPLSDLWRWASFGAEAGLPEEGIRVLGEDGNGGTWAWSDSAFLRFDGYRWEPLPLPAELDPASASSFCPSTETGFAVVANGTLYVGEGRGLRRAAAVPALPAGLKRVVSLEGGAYLLEAEDGLYRWDRQATSPLPSPSPGAAWIRRSGRGNRPLAGTPGREWHLWWQERWRRIGLPAGRVVDDVLVLPKGGLLSVSSAPDTGIWEWEGPPGSPSHPLPDRDVTSRIHALGASHDGSLVVAVYDSGRVRVRREGRWFWLSDPPECLLDARMLVFRKNGDLWVRDRHARVHLWSPSFNVFNPLLTGMRVNALARDREGRTWCGTSDGLVVLGNTGIERIDAVQGTRLGIVTGLAVDAEGYVWVSSGASFAGAFRFDGTTWRHFGPEEGLRAHRVHAIHLDSKGRLWFLGIGSIEGEDDPGSFYLSEGRLHPFGVAQGLPSGRVYAFADDSRGGLWFGTMAGLSRYRDGAWTHWNDTNGLRIRPVRSLAVTPDGRVWFGQASGISGIGWMDGDHPRYLGSREGVNSGPIHALAAGPRGRLWAATDDGLLVGSHSGFSRIASPEGLFIRSVWALLPLEESLYVGGVGGLVELEDRSADRPPPRVVLEPVIADHRRAVLRWHALGWYGSPAAHRIATRVQVDREPWSPWNTTRELTVRSLRPGTHRVRVQAKGPFETLSAPVASEFEVPVPALWVAALATLVSGSMASLAAAAWWVRRRRIDRRELQRSERRFRALVEGFPLPIIELDPRGGLIGLNPAGQELFGPSDAGNSRGEFLADRVPDQERNYVRISIARAAAGQAVEFATSIRTRRGVREVESNITPIFENGRITRLLGFLIDVTSRNRNDRRRRELERHVQMSGKLEAIGLLAGGIAHDFNNLLTVIGGHADLLQQTLTSPENLQAVREILDAHDRAGVLTRKLLAFSRSQPNQLAPLDAAEAVRGVGSLLRRVIEERVSIHLDCDPTAGWILADPVQLEQILLNLAINARDAMPDGGTIHLQVRGCTVGSPRGLTRGRVEAGRYVVLSVRDSGPGIPHEHIEKVFDPFFTTKPPGQGTGLGLFSVARIVASLGGAVEVESRPGSGTEFRVWLPATEQRTGRESSENPQPAPRGRSQAILLVEDEVAILELAGRALARAGFRVVTARDGEQALRILRDPPHAIDALVTDLVLPSIGGVQLADLYRRRGGTRILFVSGYAGEGFEAELESGSSFLAKPFTPKTLVQRVHELFEDTASPVQ